MDNKFIDELRRVGVLADADTFIKKGVHLMCEAPVSLAGTKFLYPMSIGRYTYIKDGYVASLSSIGRFCSIGQNLRVGEGMHPTSWLSSHPFQYGAAEWFKFWPEYRDFTPEMSLERGIVREPPTIGNDVWIGANVTIMRGVTVGDGAVIGAGAVVTKDVEAYSIVGGTPAKVIRKRFSDEVIARMLRVRWWDYSLDTLGGVPFNDIDRALDVVERRVEGVDKPKFHRVKITSDEMSNAA